MDTTNLMRPQFYRDWFAREWIYECFTCTRFIAFAPTKKLILKQVDIHDKECLGGWA